MREAFDVKHHRNQVARWPSAFVRPFAGAVLMKATINRTPNTPCVAAFKTKLDRVVCLFVYSTRSVTIHSAFSSMAGSMTKRSRWGLPADQEEGGLPRHKRGEQTIVGSGPRHAIEGNDRKHTKSPRDPKCDSCECQRNLTRGPVAPVPSIRESLRTQRP
jgi:hypothetical protein